MLFLTTILSKAIDLNERFASLIKSSDVLSLVTEPSFALSVFHVKVPATLGDELATQNNLTIQLHERLEAMKDIVLTRTLLNGISAIRFAVGALATEERHVVHAFELIESEAKRLVAEKA